MEEGDSVVNYFPSRKYCHLVLLGTVLMEAAITDSTQCKTREGGEG